MSHLHDEFDKMVTQKKYVEAFLTNCLTHVKLVDERSEYAQERNVYKPNSIRLESDKGPLGEGLIRLLQVGWNTALRKIQKFYQGEKAHSNPFSAAYCAAFNQACMMYFNIDTSDGSIKVDNMDDALNLLKQFQLFGAISLGELALVEEEYGLQILQTENNALRKEKDELIAKIKQLEGSQDIESDIETDSEELED